MANNPPVVTLRKVQPLATTTPIAKLGDRAPGIKSLAQTVPRGIGGSPAAAVEAAGGNVSPEVARALPRAEGNQQPYAMQSDQTDMFDMLTTSVGQSKQFYVTNRWIRVTLTLQTAGPVVVSTRAEVVPVLSGKGTSLVTGQPITFTLPRGSSLYYGCASVQRVSVIIEPVPWANEIAGKIDGVAGVVGEAARSIVGALQALRRGR